MRRRGEAREERCEGEETVDLWDFCIFVFQSPRDVARTPPIDCKWFPGVLGARATRGRAFPDALAPETLEKHRKIESDCTLPYLALAGLTAP